jgi:hypothetical protein
MKGVDNLVRDEKSASNWRFLEVVVVLARVGLDCWGTLRKV